MPMRNLSEHGRARFSTCGWRLTEQIGWQGDSLEQQIYNGLFIGSIYALFAVGYTLVFGILDILNLAHQAVFMLGAIVALALVADAHLSFWVALPLAVAAGGLIGGLL